MPRNDPSSSGTTRPQSFSSTARRGQASARLEDAVDASQRRQRMVQVADLSQLDDEPPGDDPVAARGDAGAHEIDVAVCERSSDVGEQAPAVQGLDLHLDQVGGLGVIRPGDGDEALGLALELIDVLAVGPVH